MKAFSNGGAPGGGLLGGLLLAGLLLTAGCTTQQTPEERAVEHPDPQAPPAAPAAIGLDKKVEVPAIDVDTDVRMPERQ